MKQPEAGRATKELCREHGISEATFYNWKSRYGGMKASDVKRLKDLEEENSRLKKMYAELSLDHSILKDVISKKAGALPQKAADRRDCQQLWYTGEQSLQDDVIATFIILLQKPKDDSEVTAAWQALAFKHPCYGFRKLFAYKRRQNLEPQESIQGVQDAEAE